MSTDMQDLIAKLQMAQANQGAPSFAGIAAPMDPAASQNILTQLQNQASVDQAGNTPGGGEWNFLLNAGKKDFQRAANSFGNAAQQGANIINGGPPTLPGTQNAALQRNAILAAKTVEQQAISQGADPLAAQSAGLQVLQKAGIDVSKQLADNQEQAQKVATGKQTAFKDEQQGNAAADEISNRAQQRDLDKQKFNQSTAKDTWSTVTETPQTVVQKNGLGEVRVQQKQNASQAAAANVSPDAMQAMLNSYHTTGTVPSGLGRNPAMAGAFWQAESDYQKATGNDAGAVLAAKAGAKANTDALTQTQKQLSQTTSYFDTMDKNIGAASSLADKLNLSDQPTLNRAVAAFEKGTSDPDFAKYRVFFDSVANEYAKIKSGALGNAPVSDSARKEAQDILIPLMGAGGVKAAFDAVKQEGKNRLDSLSTQRDALVTRLTGKAPPAAAAASSTAPNVVDFGSLK